MSLNLKNPRAHQLATQLSKITGETITTTVILALEQRLDRERNKFGRASKRDRILEFAGRFSAGLPKSLKSSGHASLLYGPDGLPR